MPVWWAFRSAAEPGGLAGPLPRRCSQCRPPGRTRRPPHPDLRPGRPEAASGRGRPRPHPVRAGSKLTVPVRSRSFIIPNERCRLPHGFRLGSRVGRPAGHLICREQPRRRGLLNGPGAPSNRQYAHPANSRSPSTDADRQPVQVHEHRRDKGDGFTARRSYPRSMPLTSTYAVRGMIAGCGRPLCVRGHRAWSTAGGGKTHGRGRWERLRRPSARLLASELAFQDACSLSSSPSSPGSDSGRVSWAPRASVIRSAPFRAVG